MSRRTRRVVAVVALCVAASMALGVGSYSSVSAERGVSVSVVPPEEAYLGFGEDLQCGMGEGTGDNDAFVRNQFGGNATIERITVEVTAKGGYVRVGTGGRTTQLEPDESTVLEFEGPYVAGDSVGIQVKPPNAKPSQGKIPGADRLRAEVIEATGPNLRVSGASRTYDVNCPGDSSGNGTATAGVTAAGEVDDRTRSVRDSPDPR